MTTTSTTERDDDARIHRHQEAGGRVAPDRLHPLRVQLRHRGPPRRRRPHLRADPRRQGPPGVAGLHLREGAAARPLPERPPPADVAAAPAARRHLRADRLGHGHRRGRRRVRPGPRHPRREHDLLLRRRRPGQPPRRRLRVGDPGRAGQPLPVERAGPGEDRRVLGQRQAARRTSPAATSSTPRWRCSSARTRGSRTASPTPAPR